MEENLKEIKEIKEKKDKIEDYLTDIPNLETLSKEYTLSSLLDKNIPDFEIKKFSKSDLESLSLSDSKKRNNFDQYNDNSKKSKY
jgi:hypothetical protein